MQLCRVCNIGSDRGGLFLTVVLIKLLHAYVTLGESNICVGCDPSGDDYSRNCWYEPTIPMS